MGKRCYKRGVYLPLLFIFIFILVAKGRKEEKRLREAVKTKPQLMLPLHYFGQLTLESWGFSSLNINICLFIAWNGAPFEVFVELENIPLGAEVSSEMSTRPPGVSAVPQAHGSLGPIPALRLHPLPGSPSPSLQFPSPHFSVIWQIIYIYIFLLERVWILQLFPQM